MFVFVIFFFKHKTAYELRISDWSSDVCSSDRGAGTGRAARRDGSGQADPRCRVRRRDRHPGRYAAPAARRARGRTVARRIGRADRYRQGATLSDRKSTTSELQSLMRISYAVFCLKNKKIIKTNI